MKQTDFRRSEYLILLLICIVMIALFYTFFQREISYQRYETGTTAYEKAIVTELLDQDLVLSGADTTYFTGYQQVVVEMKEGIDKGQQIQLENYVTLTHNVVVKEGTDVIICADRPEGVEPYYSIYNYDRSTGILAAIIGFLLLIVAIGRYRGIRAAIGLAFSLALILCYMMPGLYEGKTASLTILSTIASASVISCFCISGMTMRTVCNILNTILGTGAAAMIYFILMKLLHLSVGTIEAAEGLQLIANATGMSLYGIMFAGILIGALGAVMDVAVSLGASLWELKQKNPFLGRRELFHSGMNIGKDMIGTMTNTLIFAFMGGALPTLCIYISYGVNASQFISSDFLAWELAMGIAGSGAVILTVPISALLCGLAFSQGGPTSSQGCVIWKK